MRNSAFGRIGTVQVLLACLVTGGIASAALAFYLLGVPEIGFSLEQHDGAVLVRAAASPILVGWSIFSAALTSLFMRMKCRRRPLTPAAWTRRAAALVIDSVFFMTASIGIVTLAPLTAEAVRTGHFAWQFTRQYAVWQDHVVGSIAILAILALFMVYRAWPMQNGTQTIGGFLMSVAVVYERAEPISWRIAWKAAFWDVFESWPSVFTAKQSWLARFGCRSMRVE